MSTFLDKRDPKTLDEALVYAGHIEDRIKYQERTRAAATFHISRRKESPLERPRSPSPYSLQMTKMETRESKLCKGSGLNNSYDKEEFSTTESSSADGEDSDDSEAPVFRKAYTVLPSSEPSIVKTTPSPKTAPPKIPIQNPPFLPLHDPVVDVYVDGASIFHKEVQNTRAGIGVWFGSNHALIISKQIQGRQTNNRAEI
ncbi:ribonuclease H1-like [Belonocnema kinseyi]|uniref:ribonuclease H1-like n=1 Tax=Belonocnema kinseyi TaxID=2817044 RepID=UPI00143DAE31|nr:ribonuclease H1-like [Belonocnema kinseyi]